VFDRGDRPDYEVVLRHHRLLQGLSGFLPSPEGAHDRREAGISWRWKRKRRRSGLTEQLGSPDSNFRGA
jgi:hypothetical protein